MSSMLNQYAALIDLAVQRRTSNREMFLSIVSSLDRRMVAIEDQEHTFEAAKNQMIAISLANVSAILQPVADDLLNTLADAEARLAGLEEGVLFADHVNLAPISGLDAENTQDALIEIKGLIDTSVSKLGDTMSGPLTLYADPALPLHAATKQYVDGLASGLAVKQSVAAASPTGVDVNIASAPAALDGHTGVAGERWLIRQNTNPAQNGIYIFNGAGSALTRAPDMDTWGEVLASVIAVDAGTTNANTVWAASVSAGGTIGTTAITFNKFGSFQPLNANLSAFSGLDLSAADRFAYSTGGGAMGFSTVTAKARELLDDADAATMQATLGLGSAALEAATAFALAVHSHAMGDITGLAAALAAKQDVTANLTALAGLGLAADKLPYATGAGALALADFPLFGRSLVAANSSLAARGVLELGSAALETIGTTGAVVPKLNAANTFSGTTSIAAILDAQQQFRMSGVLTPPDLTTASVTDYNPTGLATASILRLKPTGLNVSIYSLAGGFPGRVITIENIDSFQWLTLVDDDGTNGTAANRFLCNNFGWAQLQPHGRATLIYDGVSSRWRVRGPSPTMAGQVQQEAAISYGEYVSPASQHWHPSALKIWGATTGGGVPVLGLSYGVTSIGDTAVGRMSVTFSNTLGSNAYPIAATIFCGSNVARIVDVSFRSATAIIMDCYDAAGVLTDPGASSGGYNWQIASDLL